MEEFEVMCKKESSGVTILNRIIYIKNGEVYRCEKFRDISGGYFYHVYCDGSYMTFSSSDISIKFDDYFYSNQEIRKLKLDRINESTLY
jgi:hypothetical protein